MALGKRQTDLNGFYDLSSLTENVSFKSKSMSLGVVLLQEMFTQMRTPQSDAIYCILLKKVLQLLF